MGDDDDDDDDSTDLLRARNHIICQVVYHLLVSDYSLRLLLPFSALHPMLHYELISSYILLVYKPFVSCVPFLLRAPESKRR